MEKKLIIEDFYRSRPLGIYDVYAPTIRADREGLKVLTINSTDFTIRKLTPREALRLQGVDEKTIDRLIESDISDTQLFRATGDAVTVPVVEAIAKKMIAVWEAEKDATYQNGESIRRQER